MNPIPLLAAGALLAFALKPKADATSDPNVPSDVAQAVTIALSVERSPANLRSFALTLHPYPQAQAALNAQAQKLGG
jgi:hypothetical protein